MTARHATPGPASCGCPAGHVPLAGIAPALAERLAGAGLEIRELSRHGEVIEIVVAAPGRGRVILDRFGLLEWDHWCHLSRDDDTGERLAAVITACLAGGPAPQAPPAGP